MGNLKHIREYTKRNTMYVKNKTEKLPAKTIGLSSGDPPQQAISTKYGGSQDP